MRPQQQLLELTQLCLPKLKLKLRLRPKHKLKLKPKLVPVLVLLLRLPLELMLPPTRAHNTLLNRSSMEVSLSMSSSKELEHNAKLDRLLTFSTPELLHLTVKSSIHQFQEVNQSLSLLEK